MNDFYQYKYENGLQFVTTAKPEYLQLFINILGEEPKLLGVWRIKTIK
jgi:hypothetical protein